MRLSGILVPAGVNDNSPLPMITANGLFVQRHGATFSARRTGVNRFRGPSEIDVPLLFSLIAGVKEPVASLAPFLEWMP